MLSWVQMELPAVWSQTRSPLGRVSGCLSGAGIHVRIRGAGRSLVLMMLVDAGSPPGGDFGGRPGGGGLVLVAVLGMGLVIT